MKRTLAFLLVVVVVCAFLFVSFEAEHSCVGEDCRICCLLNACLHTLRVCFAATAVLAVAVLTLLVRVCCFNTNNSDNFSLISHKVKLSI